MKRITLYLAVLIVIASAAELSAGSPVWEISKGKHRIFLGGTIHVLAASDFPLPEAFDRAYRQSEVLVFETDLGKTQDPEFATAMMGQMVYTDGRTLRDRVRPSTFDALSRFSGDRGIPAASLINFKPGMVMVFLTMAEMERLGAGGAGVDEFYYRKGQADGRPMAFLESPMAQIRFLADIGIGREDKMINYLLDDIGKLPALLPVMKQAWRSGDNQRLYRETMAPLKAEYPDLYHTLMVERNRAWLPVILDMLDTPETEFILVGAAHLAGDQGLLALLRAKGARAVNQ